jgi:hypothetical protein
VKESQALRSQACIELSGVAMKVSVKCLGGTQCNEIVVVNKTALFRVDVEILICIWL